MWLLSFVPDSFLLWLVNTILIVGAIGAFLSFFLLHKILNKIPALAPYHLLIQIVSAVLLVAGIYFKGGYSVEMEWRDKLKAAEERAAIAEVKAAETNIIIQEKIVERIKVVKEIQIVNQDRIVKQKEYIDRDCKVPQIAIDIHNDAARNRKPGDDK
jgi:preprotein translocase subunit SecF